MKKHHMFIVLGVAALIFFVVPIGGQTLFQKVKG